MFEDNRTCDARYGTELGRVPATVDKLDFIEETETCRGGAHILHFPHIYFQGLAQLQPLVCMFRGPQAHFLISWPSQWVSSFTHPSNLGDQLTLQLSTASCFLLPQMMISIHFYLEIF